MTKQITYGLSVVRSANGLAQSRRDIQHLDFGTLNLFLLAGNRIGHNNVRQTRVIDHINRFARKNSVRNPGNMFIE